MTIDEGFIVRAVDSSSDAAPFAPCAGSRDEFSALVDAPMGKGWHRRVRDGFGRRKSCSYLAALFESIVTTAYQASCGGPDPRGKDPLMEAVSSRGCWPLFVVHANARSLPR